MHRNQCCSDRWRFSACRLHSNALCSVHCALDSQTSQGAIKFERTHIVRNHSYRHRSPVDVKKQVRGRESTSNHPNTFQTLSNQSNYLRLRLTCNKWKEDCCCDRNKEKSENNPINHSHLVINYKYLEKITVFNLSVHTARHLQFLRSGLAHTHKHTQDVTT